MQPSLGHCERASRRIPSEPTCPASTSHTYSVETQKQSPHQSKLLNMNQVEEINLQHFEFTSLSEGTDLDLCLHVSVSSSLAGLKKMWLR